MFEGLLQPMHMLVILAIAMIFFGPGKLPELGSSLGKSIREFKKALSDDEKDNAIDFKETNASSDLPQKKT